MKNWLIVLLALTFIACQPQTDLPTAPTLNNKYSTASAEQALNLAQQLANGKQPTEQQWATLFESDGYQSYLCGFDEEQRKNYIRSALTAIFSEDHISQRDSLLAMPMPIDQDPRPWLLHHNFQRLKLQMDSIDRFLAETDFPALLEEGRTMTQRFLPQAALNTTPDLHEVNLILMEPDAYVTGCGLIVDAVNVANQGTEEFVKLLAHEYHHNYRNMTAPNYKHPLMSQLDDAHTEGLADLIDKPLPPIKHFGFYPKFITDRYNEAYANTPQMLAHLDSLTQSHLAGTLDETAYEQALAGYFPMTGHPNGFYMANLIREQGKMDELIATYDDLIAFVLLYNEAATQQAGEYVFSDTFMEYVMSLRVEKTATPAEQYCDEPYAVTFQLTVPNEADEVFITGSRPALGDWSPGQVKLEKTGPLERSITLDVQAPIEFKFTQGDWATEGFAADHPKGPNLNLGFHQDTTIHYTIEAWNSDVH